ncbi:MAG: glycosyltransferase family 39 protein [Candidatus Aenigmatarchaeota archaeon]
MYNKGFPKWFIFHSFLFSILIFGGFFIFGSLSRIRIISAFFIIITFLSITPIVIKIFVSYSSKIFIWRLFLFSFLLRFSFIFILYFLFKYFTGAPFVLGEGFDDHTYHILGIQIAERWKQGDFSMLEPIAWVMSFNYLGYPAFVGALYYLLGPSTILARVANCIIGSFIVLLTYKIGKEIWGESVGRTAGILAMLYPLMIFYSAVQNKDTILVFLVLIVIYYIIKLGTKRKIKFWELGFIVGALFSLFTFRTVVAVIILFSILIYSIYPSGNLEGQKVGKRLIKISIGIFIILVSLFLLIKIGGEKAAFKRIIERIIVGYGYAEYRASRWGIAGSRISSFRSIYLFLGLAFFAPFPTLVDILLDTTSAPIRSEYYFIEATFIWNIFSFFALIGLINSMKNKSSESLLLWFFTLSYLFVLAQSNFIMHERFRLVIAPFLIIFTALGLHSEILKKERFLLSILYFFAIAILIIGWNYVRLAGRGMI